MLLGYGFCVYFDWDKEGFADLFEKKCRNGEKEIGYVVASFFYGYNRIRNYAVLPGLLCNRERGSIKHDMANHILILERLYEENKTAEAKIYSQELKTELAQITCEMKSGNPVTDVILHEFQKEAEKKEISFYTQFYYPVDSNLNVFDVSVILNNALQNAVENTDQAKGQQISIVSYRRNNAYIINIHNDFSGNLKWNIENEIPATWKENTSGHGYGLLNIRRVAQKYSGDIDIEVKNGKFYLYVMLMLE